MSEENVTLQTDETQNETNASAEETVQEPLEESKQQADAQQLDKSMLRRLKNLRKEDANLIRDKMILSQIRSVDLLEYLQLEKERLEIIQRAKEARSKRILSAFEVVLALVSVVVAIYFLKDEPTILMSILYILGLLVALWIWKKPGDK